jgi:hypothetical protein
VGGWISVNDRLPETGVSVLCTDGEMLEVGFRSTEDNPEYINEWIDFYFLVTHWTEIPAMPKADRRRVNGKVER